MLIRLLQAYCSSMVIWQKRRGLFKWAWQENRAFISDSLHTYTPSFPFRHRGQSVENDLTWWRIYLYTNFSPQWKFLSGPCNWPEYNLLSKFFLSQNQIVINWLLTHSEYFPIFNNALPQIPLLCIFSLNAVAWVRSRTLLNSRAFPITQNLIQFELPYQVLLCKPATIYKVTRNNVLHRLYQF